MYDGDIYSEKLSSSNAMFHSMCSQLRYLDYCQQVTLRFYLYNGNHLLEDFYFLDIK